MDEYRRNFLAQEIYTQLPFSTQEYKCVPGFFLGGG